MMKCFSIKHNLIVICCLVAQVVAKSQNEAASSESDEKKIIAGVTIGGNQNVFRRDNKFTIWNNGVNEYDFNAGLFGKYTVKDFLRVKAEILYFRQGAELPNQRFNSTTINTDWYLQLNTIRVPVLAELSLPSMSGNSIVPRLVVGGYYGYMFNAKSIYTQHYDYGAGFTSSAHGNRDVSYAFRKNQYGLIFGIGASAMQNKAHVDLLYSYGLNDVATNGLANDPDLSGALKNFGGKFYPSSVSLNLSYTLFEF